MTHVYIAAHVAPAPQAPETYSTVASATPLTGQDIAALVAPKCAVPLARITQWQLSYPPALSDPATALAQVMQAYANCSRCHLADRRNMLVFYRGDPNAVVACIGEGPGKDEDMDGRSFVGASGRLQTGMFRENRIDADRFFWMNLVGCRPCNTRFDQKDRPPQLVEKVACSERTLWLLRSVRPRVVLCLGNESTALFWPEDATPYQNTWHTLRSPQHPDDWIIVGVLRHQSDLLRVLPISKMYGEYAANRLRMMRELRERLPE